MPKSRGGSLAVGTYIQRGSAPPPPGVTEERKKNKEGKKNQEGGSSTIWSGVLVLTVCVEGIESGKVR